jgi:hypothetical protein
MYEIRGENMNSEIQIRFIEGTAIDSRIIRWQTRAWCSHVEAILPGEKTLGALFNGGVAIRNFSDKCYRDVKRWEDWHIPCEQYQATNFYSFLHDQIGKPYDWRAIISFALGERDWQAKGSWFCSEFMFAGMKEAGLYTPPAQLPSDRLTPRDSYLIFTGLPETWK